MYGSKNFLNPPTLSFHSHRSIQTRVTVRKRPIRVKIDDIFVLCDHEIWQMTLKNNRAFFLCNCKLCGSFHSHRWIQTVDSLKGSNCSKICSDLCDLELWFLTLTSCIDITFVNGNNSWKFHDDTMTGTLCKKCDKQTDRRTDRDGQKQEQSETA